MLRRDTLWIIDGDGSDALIEGRDGAKPQVANGKEPQRETVQESKQQNTTGTVETVEERGETSTSPKCMFFGVVPIDIQRFLESGVTVVECPGCACTRTLEPHGGVLRFKSHKKRKTNTPKTGRRWARGKGKTDWDVAGG